jgi:hypothetical protein
MTLPEFTNRIKPRFILIHLLAAFFAACAAGQLYTMLNFQYFQYLTTYEFAEINGPKGFHYEFPEAIRPTQLFVRLAYSPLIGIFASLIISLVILLKKRLFWANYLFLFILSTLSFSLFIGHSQRSIPMPTNYIERHFGLEYLIALNVLVFLLLVLFLLFKRRINSYTIKKQIE